MPTGEGLETVHELAASAAVGVLADFRGYENPVHVYNISNDGIDQGLLDACEVRLTARQQVRSWFSKDQLHALGDHECGRERQSKSHPANVPLPELPTPNEGLGSSSASRWSGDKHHAYDENDAGGRDEGDKDEQPCRDGFVVLKGVRDGEVDGGEGAVVWVNVFPTSADCSDCSVCCQSLHSWCCCGTLRSDACRNYRAASGGSRGKHAVTYIIHIQSKTYDATSFIDGTPMPRTFFMVAASESCV